MTGPQSTYEYPPIYHFAPFFTLQRNPATFSSQIKLWTRFVLDYCQFHRIFVLNLEGAWEKSGGAGGLFRNDLIKRELSLDAQREVLKALVDEGKTYRNLHSFEKSSCLLPPNDARERRMGPTNQIKEQILRISSIKSDCILEKARGMGRDDLQLDCQYWSESKYHDVFRINRGRSSARNRCVAGWPGCY